jgi:hypothetical protein
MSFRLLRGRNNARYPKFRRYHGKKTGSPHAEEGANLLLPGSSAGRGAKVGFNLNWALGCLIIASSCKDARASRRAAFCPASAKSHLRSSGTLELWNSGVDDGCVGGDASSGAGLPKRRRCRLLAAGSAGVAGPVDEGDRLGKKLGSFAITLTLRAGRLTWLGRKTPLPFAGPLDIMTFI